MKITEETRRELKRLVTVKEATQMTGISDPGIRRLIKDKRLPALKLGVLLDPDDLDKIKFKFKKRGKKPKKVDFIG